MDAADTEKTNVALIGVLVSNYDSVEQMNAILHTYGDYIIGRMGIPYKKEGISILSIALDAPQEVVNALSGKLGALPGVSTKTVTPRY